MDKNNDKNFNIATFNVRGMTNDHKKYQLVVKDMIRYNVDVCCKLQETKVQEEINH